MRNHDHMYLGFRSDFEKRSKSAVKVYEDADGSIAHGITADADLPKIQYITISLSWLFGLTIYTADVEKWKRAKQSGNENAYMWLVFYEAITPTVLRRTIEIAKKVGYENGRAAIQQEARKLFNI